MSTEPSATRRRRQKLLWLLLAFLPITLVAVQLPASTQSSTIADLWIDLRLGPPLIPLFNLAARDNDIARVDNPNQVGQLDRITHGRKMVIFKSIAEAEAALPSIASKIDIIGYNLEHTPVTPADEQADPLASVRRMRELADTYDLELAFGPDHDFALSHGVEVAPFVDIFVLQIQRQQTNPLVVTTFVESLAPRLHAANPDLELSVQVRTEGDVQALIGLLEALQVHLDGISILTSPDTVPVAEELVVGIRPDVRLPSRSPAGPTYVALVLLAVGLLGGGIFFLYRRRSLG